MEISERTLSCRQCESAFTWTVGEQLFSQEKGLVNAPARCPDCRAQQKLRMGLHERARTEVVCAECGDPTTVPFVPRNGTPVYCSRCFERVKESRLTAESSSSPT